MSLDNISVYGDVDAFALLVKDFGYPMKDETKEFIYTWKTPYGFSVSTFSPEPHHMFTYQYDDDLPFLNVGSEHSKSGIIGREDIPLILKTFRENRDALRQKPKSIELIEDSTGLVAFRKMLKFGSWHIVGRKQGHKVSLFNNPFQITTGYCRSADQFEIWWQDLTKEPQGYVSLQKVIQMFKEHGYTCWTCCKAANKKCGKCKVATYCSVECQRFAWSEHKKACQ
jgi:hypothetical protein